MVMRIAQWCRALTLCILLLALLLLQTHCTSIVSDVNTKPSDNKPSESTISLDPDVEEKIRAVAAEHPGGITYGILGGPDSKAAESPFVFRTEVGQPFIGQFRLWSARLVPHTYVLTCMLDYRQISCSPDSPITQTRSLSSDEAWYVPLQIPIEAAGVHDLLVVFQEDQDRDDTNERGADRTSRDLEAARVNIIAGASNEHSSVRYQTLSERPTTGRWQSGFIVSDREDPSVVQAVPNSVTLPDDLEGGWQYWTNSSSQAGQELQLYLHFDNRDEQEFTYAAMAFIDFIQIPIKVKETVYPVIFTRAKPKVWQTLTATVQMPQRIGRHEFRVLGIVEPYIILDENHPDFPVDGSLGAILWVYSSSRVCVDVR
ncbi:MAG: hypothetical protein DRP85_09200 [Candidatus Makaraimicrobium thalassicum]|nr:MAG: hypothetical protein DRP85_09200 [Candidatus Omnitrophota bacterium]